MYGLVDCNNFFVSCERVFRPELAERPVIVLSNNDGCVVAMSQEVKTLDIRRGMPLYRIRHLVDRHGIALFSGNHTLYGDMSSRVMATLSSLVPEIEVYSIDEAFLHMHLVAHEHLETEGREIVRRVRRDVGVPVSLGIAPSKTLAKVAAHFAKRYPGYRSVCIIDSEEKRRKALELLMVEEVWGIGRRLGQRLHAAGIHRAIDFADLSERQTSQMVNIVGLRTWRELNGQPCIEADMQGGDSKQICVSRSFARALVSVGEMAQAVSEFADVAARKLRRQRGKACCITVFAHTNAYREDQEQYYGTATRTPEEPTDDTLVITREAMEALATLFRSGYFYKKAGILINEIVSGESAARSLFVDDRERSRRNRLMSAIDNINSSSGPADTVHVASIDPANRLVRREHVSRLYSTRLSDIITVMTPSVPPASEM